MKNMKKLTAVLCVILICATMLTMVASADHEAPYLAKNYKYNKKNAVIVLQTMLNKEMKAKLTVSGVFDDKTEQAVINFQKKYHKKYDLEIDGKVGPQTWNALFKCCTIKKSHTGGTDMVLLLQRILNKVNNAGLDEDGKWGKQTDAAVKAFQLKYCGVNEDDGIVGPKTWNELVALYAKCKTP